ncbi:MAG: hypothetical protein AAFN59_03525, partial [Pseudomonadota bacterium]
VWAGEYVVADVADDYRIIHQDRQRNAVVTEAAPQGQTAKNWQELYKILSVRKRGNVTLNTALRPYRTKTTDDCAQQRFTLLSRGESNGFPTATFLYGCAKTTNPDLPEEWGVGKAHLGDVDVHYTLKAWRKQPTQRDVDAWIDRLEVTYVCRGTAEDTETCPPLP